MGNEFGGLSYHRFLGLAWFWVWLTKLKWVPSINHVGLLWVARIWVWLVFKWKF
jgi:hypothetical protein